MSNPSLAYSANRPAPWLPVRLAGLGFYLPPHVVSSAELERRLELPAGWIERVTGVRERRGGLGETTAGMAARAARVALARAELSVADLDLIVAASAGPQQSIPCTAVFVQRELGAPEGRSACFDVNATCLSFLFALQTVAPLVAAGSYRHALIVSSEIPDRALNPREPESAVLFGAAAAAAVLTRTASGEPSALGMARFATHSSAAELSQIRGGGTLHHPNDPATTAEMNTFQMQGLTAYKRVVRLMDGFLDDFFAACPLARHEFEAVVPHQGSRKVVETLHTRFGFRPEQVVGNLAERGNCIAASLPLALAEAVQAGRIRRGQHVLLVGVGAGFTLGAMALRF
jgi:3-oxoacyl-[acyl-carrier-protein] synthase-3